MTIEISFPSGESSRAHSCFRPTLKAFSVWVTKLRLTNTLSIQRKPVEKKIIRIKFKETQIIKQFGAMT